MKSFKKIIVFMLLISIFPIGAKANIGIEANAEARIKTPENKIDLRRLDLQKKLFKEEINERRDSFQKAKEAFKNASSDTRNMMRAEFRAKFVERFKFTLDKLAEFQTRTEAKIKMEESLGVDVSKAKLKLEESKSFSAQIETNITELKTLLDEKYAEDERDEKKAKAKELFEEIKSDIKASHEALKEVFKEIRLAKQEMRVETSTEINIDNN